MKKQLFHGSTQLIEAPQFGKGARTNDYGRGFYCTEIGELAKEWACAKNTDGYVNQYKLDLKGLNILNLNDGTYSILNWLALLTENRTYWEKGSISEQAKKYLHDYFLLDLAGYDIIIGYRADDSYFSFAQDFVANTISMNQLSEAMRLGKLGEQIVLKSEKSFDQITYVSSEMVARDEYFVKKNARDKAARREYRKRKTVGADINDVFMLDIMREGMKDGDARLR